MGLFSKLKQGLGLGTAKIKLEAPNSVPWGTPEIQGTVTLTALSDQKVKNVKVTLVEKSVATVNNETKDVRKDLQKFVLNEPFALKTGEIRTIPFTLSTALGTALSFQVLGASVTISGAANHQQSSLEVVATADLEGVALDPMATQALLFTQS